MGRIIVTNVRTTVFRDKTSDWPADNLFVVFNCSQFVPSLWGANLVQWSGGLKIAGLIVVSIVLVDIWRHGTQVLMPWFADFWRLCFPQWASWVWDGHMCTLHVLLTMHVLNQDSNIFCYIVILHAMLRLKLQRKMILLQFAAVKF